MPIYAYKCESCGHSKDVLQKISDPLLTVCPQCGEPAFKKQLTAAGFQLKGSGWYVTDFKDGNKAPATAAPAAAADAAKAAPVGDAAAAKPSDAPASAPAPAASAPAKSESTPAPAASPRPAD